MKLPSIFVSFKQCLVESDGALKKHKEKFRSGLLQDADDFKKTVTDIVEVFETTGPFTSGSTQDEVRMYVYICKYMYGIWIALTVKLQRHTYVLT